MHQLRRPLCKAGQRRDHAAGDKRKRCAETREAPVADTSPWLLGLYRNLLDYAGFDAANWFGSKRHGMTNSGPHVNSFLGRDIHSGLIDVARITHREIRGDRKTGM
jgi:hypothetical protein